MGKTTKQDNSTLTEKVTLRKAALDLLAERGVIAPVILETHGGMGELWSKVYPHLRTGTVFEKDDKKVRLLGLQRPSWSVYQADVEEALQRGVGRHLDYDLVDVDPYGSPFETFSALAQGGLLTRPYTVLVVNDGLRQAVSNGTAWHVKALHTAVERFGNDLFDSYLEVCRYLVERIFHAHSLTHFRGYYCGRNGMMTHYLCVLESQTPHMAGSDLQEA